MTTDLTADDDSVQIVVFYQYLEKLEPLPNPPVASIQWKVDYGDANVEGQTDIAVSGDDYAEVFSCLLHCKIRLYSRLLFAYRRKAKPM